MPVQHHLEIFLEQFSHFADEQLKAKYSGFYATWGCAGRQTQSPPSTHEGVGWPVEIVQKHRKSDY